MTKFRRAAGKVAQTATTRWPDSRQQRRTVRTRNQSNIYNTTHTTGTGSPHQQNEQHKNRLYYLSSYSGSIIMTTTTTTVETTTSATTTNTIKRRRLPPSSQTQNNKLFPTFLKPPCDYESLYSSYLSEWQGDNNTLRTHVEINDLIVVAAPSERVVVAVTSLGQVIVMKTTMTTMMMMMQGDENENDSTTTKRIIDVSTKPLRTVVLLKNRDGSTRLVVGGDGGMWSLDGWQDHYHATNEETTPPMEEPIIVRISDVAIQEIQVVVFIAAAEVEETSDVYALTKEGHILRYSDGGGKSITIYKKTAKPATTFRFVSSSDKSGGPTLIVIGTAMSEVLLWDVAKAKVVDTLSLTKAFSKGTTHKKASCVYKVTSILVTQQQWWTVGGARVVENNNNGSDPHGCGGGGGGGGGGGFLCTWHGPTRSVAAQVETRETIQGLLLGQDSNNGGGGGGAQGLLLYSIANESVVSLWNSPYQLQRTHRIQMSSCPSGKAMVAATFQQKDNNADDDDDENDKADDSVTLLFVTGVGSKVDVLKDHCCVNTLEISKA
jgi:hypothetical protein